MITGMSASAGSAFSAVSTAQPSMPGIMTSSVIASGRDLSRQPERLLPAPGGDHAEALAAEEALHQVAHRRLVVDHQHRAGARVPGAASTRAPPREPLPTSTGRRAR